MSVSDMESIAGMPQKRFYRQRAHMNPNSDGGFDPPVSPIEMDWSSYYPYYFPKKDSAAVGIVNERNDSGEPSAKRQAICCDDDSKMMEVSTIDKIAKKQVEFADVGCGYGGLLIRLATLLPDSLGIGIEIRMKVSDFVNDKIKALRAHYRSEGNHAYENVAIMRTNAMKFMPNIFEKGQLSKMFFLFPDPHFKSAKHKWRIVTPQLLAEYAYVLREGGRIYCVTDVHDLFLWMDGHLDDHPLFRRATPEEEAADIVVPELYENSEEGQKVTRNKGEKWHCVFIRITEERLSVTADEFVE